jgi:hypothetical protein
MNRNSIFDPTAWIMIPIGITLAFWQAVLMGNPPPVTRDRLGKLGK